MTWNVKSNVGLRWRRPTGKQWQQPSFNAAPIAVAASSSLCTFFSSSFGVSLNNHDYFFFFFCSLLNIATSYTEDSGVV